MCDWMNNCSGNGACQANGQCKCKKGFKTADCAVRQLDLHSLEKVHFVDLPVHGPKWFMLGYHYEHHETVSLGLASGLHFDLYVSVGENTETNEYHHDFMMKNVDGPLVLDAKMIPAMRKHEGFTVAVFMHGLDERENTLLKGKLTV